MRATAFAVSLLAALSLAVPIEAEAKRSKRGSSDSSASSPELGKSSAAGAPYYRNCSEARAAGAVPIRRGEPGYAPHLDRDGDGIACEPYRKAR
jgi:hypothetical protein